MMAEYARHDMLAGLTVRVHHRSREETAPEDYDARVVGVQPDGTLLVTPLATAGAAARPNVALNSEEISLALA